MASVGMQAAIAHAAVDPSFRNSVLSDAPAACAAAGYKLNHEEMDSVREVIADDSFGASFAADMNLPEMFQETSKLVDEVAPLETDGTTEAV